ncbi:MAG TPA: hypothetical protein VEI96_05465 [Thermodesulfovibrionales bacterium]|nr:hypothetical protein [Thermodesulfovibrionales bacterium]
MSERDKQLAALSDQLDENILAVKGTLELIDASISEDDLHELLLKALGRMDTIEKLSHEMLGALKSCFDKLGGTEQ